MGFHVSLGESNVQRFRDWGFQEAEASNEDSTPWCK